MLRLLTAIAVFAAGCYEDPDYRATRFKCDALHVCPAGQTCVAGACTPGGNPVIDASSGDGGFRADGVVCGATTCPVGQQCCADITSSPRCTAIGAACTGVTAVCDGIEDCNGFACCSDPGNLTYTCTTSTRCDVEQICRDAADCTDPGLRMCCFGVGAPGAPWGSCRPAC